jgi:PAS domain S-box-containing protein
MTTDHQSQNETGKQASALEMYSPLVIGEPSPASALAASEQLLFSLMHSMTNAVFWKDRDSRYMGCNQVFSSFAGFDSSLLMGKSDRDMPWADDAEFSSEWFIDWDRAVIEKGEPKFGILERLRRADGEERWIETNKVPLRGIDGEVIGLLGTFKDVTERNDAEEQLRRTLEDLDGRVGRRTDELTRSNEALRREVEDRIRLQSQERQQREYAEALRDTAAAMSKTFDLDEVTEQTLAGVERLISNDLAAVVLADPAGRCELTLHHAGFDYVPESSDLTEVDIDSMTVIDRVRDREEPVVIDRPGYAFGPAGSTMAARMQVADQFIGYLVVESATPGFFTEAHADRLGAMADQAGNALANSRLTHRVSELAATEERQRLARELHDAVNQTLWTAALTSESLLSDIDPDSALFQRAERLRKLNRGALAEMRSLLLELRPADLTEVALDELIKHLLAALECRRTLDVTIALDPIQLEPLAHLTFYRIAQEALGNVTKHSNARTLAVRLVAGPPVELLIADDGAGFDPDTVPGGHLGLEIMRERAEAVGAELSVTSAPGHGTTMRLRFDP